MKVTLQRSFHRPDIKWVAVTGYCFDMEPDTQQDTVIHLTPRELEVVAQLAQGYSYAQISTQLEISENTLKTHIKRIYRKLNVHNRTQAILATQKLGIL